MPFTVFYFTFPLTMIFAGLWLPRLGPRRSAMLGGLLFGLGWMVASWGTIHFAFTVVGIGLIAGIGVGFAYIVPIATCIRWFPRHKGLVTGIAVAGFGGGAALVSSIGAWVMEAHGASPFDSFRWLGLAFLIVVVSSGWCIQNPPDISVPSATGTNWKRIIAHPRFRILYFAMFCGLAAGFTVNANIKELVPLGRVSTGVTAIGLFALANAAGRIVWGFFHDRIKGDAPVTVNLWFQGIILVAGPWILVSESGLLFFAGLTGFNYGGVLVLYAASVAQIWGSQSVGQIYGALFSANILAAIFPMLAGFGFDLVGSFTPALWFVAALMFIASIGIVKK
jgi:OFA family oxalate/formate antiporter-like MFS transporter